MKIPYTIIVPRMYPFLSTTNLHSECNNFLLPALITYLNDVSWELRALFFDAMSIVAPCAGVYLCVENT